MGDLEPYNAKNHIVKDDVDLLTLWSHKIPDTMIHIDGYSDLYSANLASIDELYALGYLKVTRIVKKNNVSCNIPKISFNSYAEDHHNVLEVELSWKRLKHLHKQIGLLLKEEKIKS